MKIDKNWFQNKNVRPKTFIIHMEYSPGGYRVKKAYVEKQVNQHKSNIKKVNCRAVYQSLITSDLIVN